MTTSTDLPKHELLLKLLKMTGSDNDAEALTAVRKANQLLLSADWTWDRLLEGKITVVGDPFGGLQKPIPRAPNPAAPRMPAVPRTPAAPAPPAWSPHQTAPPQPQATVQPAAANASGWPRAGRAKRTPKPRIDYSDLFGST